MASNRTEYELAIQVGGKVAASFGNSVHTVNNGFDTMTNMAKNAAKMIVGAFAAVKVGEFISDAIDTYSEFEQSMANTAAVAGATQIQYEQLELAAREMGKATTKTAAEASDALGYMMLAGWSVDDAISGLEPVLRLSEATQMDLARASDLTTDSMAALGLEVQDLGEYLDVAVMANNKANTTAEMLMEAYIGVGGIMRTLDVPIQESATALGVLANRGIKGSEAGTALNAIMINLTTGAGKAGKMMEKLGISAFDDTGKFVGLQETLLRVNEAISGMSDEEKNAALAAIGGKTHIDAFSDLMAGLTTITNSGETEWNELEANLYNSDDALMNMADTVTNTLPAAFLRLESAVDDAKISFADAFSGNLKDVINDLSEYIPTLTEKFSNFASKSSLKIAKVFSVIQKGAADIWEVTSNVGGWLIDNIDAIEVAIVGIGSAIVAYKVINGIIGMVNAFRSLSFVLTNPWLVVLVGVATAIAGIAAAVKTASKQAVQSDLAEHFGDIALSMEDVSEAAEYIVMSDNLSKIHESMKAFEELDGIADSMQDSIDAINKMNWKVSIGMELSEGDQDSYIAEIQNYIEQAQNYVTQEQYALNLNLSLFAEGDLERQNIVDQINAFYSGKLSELEELGTKLNETVTAAFEDGLLELDEVNEITELQEQMARIQESLATNDFDAKLKTMELQYSGAELDAESFQALQEELALQVETASAEYDESLQLRIANANVMLEDGAIDQAQYDSYINEYWDDYLSSMSELESKSLDFQMNTITQQYSDELAAFDENMAAVMEEYSSGNYAMQWNEQTTQTWDAMIKDLYSNGITDESKDAISKLLESMQPSIEQVEALKKQYEDLGKELPESLENALATADILGAITARDDIWGTAGDTESLWTVAENAIVNDERFNEVVNNLTEKGWELPEAIATGTTEKQEEFIAPAIDSMYQYSNRYLNEVFSKDLSVTTDVRIKVNPIFTVLPGLEQNLGILSRYQFGMGGHADGGIFDKPHMAWFAEEGPEAAIPLDGSQNAISLWEKTGKLLGMFDGGMTSSVGTDLYNGMSAQTNNTTNESEDARQFIFAPNITMGDNSSRESIDEALAISMEQFRDLMEQYMFEKSRVSF